MTVLLLPYLVSGYVAGRVANKAEYLNCLVLAVILVGPFAFLYPPADFITSLFYIVPVLTILVGAILAYLARVNDEKRIARMKQQAQQEKTP